MTELRYAFVADPHVGNMKQHGGAVVVGCNQRARDAIQVLARSAARAKELGCHRLVVLGDLFDTSNPNPQMVAQVAAALSVGPPVEIIVGNHDQVSTALGDHALAPFSLGKNLQVHEAPARVGDLILVPFQPGAGAVWLAESLKQVNCKDGILCIHLGIEDGDTPHFLRGAHDSIHVSQLRTLMEQHGIKATFAGNWHNGRDWEEERIYQCGVICPKTFSDDGYEGRGDMLVYDPAHWLVDHPERFNIPGPRFLKFDDVETLEDWTTELEEKRSKGYTIYARVTAEPDEMDEARELRDGAPQGITIDISLDATEAKAAMTSAASVARSAETFEEALDKYVDQYPIDEPGTKAGVLERIRQFRRAVV
jgi:hypothetical protein